MRRLLLVLLAVAVAPVALLGPMLLAAGQGGASSTPGLNAVTMTEIPEPYRTLTQRFASTCQGLSPAFLAAILDVESHFGTDPRSQRGSSSTAGALGPAQFKPGTWVTWGRDGDPGGNGGPPDPFDPPDAVAGEAAYVCHILGEVRPLDTGTDTDVWGLVAAGYNAGEDAVKRYRGIPPFPQTQAYVPQVLDDYYRWLGETAPVGAADSGPVPQQAGQAIRFAAEQLGKPYQWGAEGPSAFDCSGLTWAAWQAAGLNWPRMTARGQFDYGRRVARDQLQPGDLVFFANDTSNPATIHHVGLYVGAGMMIEAPHSNALVRLAHAFRADFIGAARPTG